MNKKLKYILKEIKKAEKQLVESYMSLNYYKARKDKKYYEYCEWYITEAEEILSNLEISIKIMLEEENE